MTASGIAHRISSVGRQVVPDSGTTLPAAGRLASAAEELRSIVKEPGLDRLQRSLLSRDHDALVGYLALARHLEQTPARPIAAAHQIRTAVTELGGRIGRAATPEGAERRLLFNPESTVPTFIDDGRQIGELGVVTPRPGETATRITAFDGRPSIQQLHYARSWDEIEQAQKTPGYW